MRKSDLKTGMIVTLRRGVERVIVGRFLFDEEGTITSKLDYYNDDLTYTNNCTSEDIMKIEYGGKVIWERVEWDKVPFGTKVRAWDYEDENKQVGRFLAYDDKDDEELPFFIFIKDSECEAKAWWFKNCEIIKEGEKVQ